jgi:hypothetical protein
MSPRKTLRKVPAAKRRELDVAAAVARENIMQLHVTRVVKLIDFCADRISAARVLNIYLRLHGMVGPSAELLAGRVLAALGTRASRGSPVATLFVEGEESAEPESVSLFRVVRDRLKGRVHHELRHWFELHTGATHVALLETHVRHAQKFVRELTDSHTIGAACALYGEMVGMPLNMKEPLYMFVLDQMAGEQLPRGKANGKAPALVETMPTDELPRSKSNGKASTALVEDVSLFQKDQLRAKIV